MRLRLFAILSLVTACGDRAQSSPSAAQSVVSAAPQSSVSIPVVVSSAPPPPPAPVHVRYEVAAMGDSLTDEKSHGGKYLHVLKRHCPQSSFVSFGKGGNMVSMMRTRFMRDVYGEGSKKPPPHWTHLIILGGLGDVLSNKGGFRTPAKVETDILWMTEKARAQGAKVFVLTLPPWGAMRAYDFMRGEFTKEVNTWIGQAAKDGKIDGMFDTRPHLICGNPEVLCPKLGWPDHIHWSKEGHEVVGEALYKALFSDCE